jgi:sterol desaturase/sphingolipid hydroxylase (fatty acid hydroxylase superfamily)
MVLAEAFWPIKCDISIQPVTTMWSVCVTLLLHDAYYYGLHRAMHSSKWLYRQVHATHHDREVMLEARTGMVITAAEAFLSGGLFYTLSIAFNCVFFTRMVSGTHVFNLWVLFTPALTTGMLGNIGHSGLKYHTPFPLLALNPFLLALLFPGTAHSAHDHQLHHERCGVNFALYFRHMDDWFGTAADAGSNKRAPSSMLLMAYNLSYYAAISWALANWQWLAAAVCSKAGLALLCCSVVLPLPAAGWQWLRRLSFWDRVRQAYACSVTCEQQLDMSQRYIFAYHPHGLLSRGWWLAFAFQGKQSPVAALR